jgi:hypothetical protein
MTIDPTQQVDVFTRANTTLAATCPPAPATAARARGSAGERNKARYT